MSNYFYEFTENIEFGITELTIKMLCGKNCTNACNLFLLGFRLVFNTVESGKLIIIQYKKISQSRYGKSIFMPEKPHPLSIASVLHLLEL